jgi:hypothetical protein
MDFISRTLVILLGAYLFIAGGQFLGNPPDHEIGWVMCIGGGSLAAVAVWSALRCLWQPDPRHARGFDVLPPKTLKVIAGSGTLDLSFRNPPRPRETRAVQCRR